MRRSPLARIAWPAGVSFFLVTLLAMGCSGDGGGPAGTETPTPEATEAVDTGTPGVFDDRVLFGQSAAFSGPAQELGKNMRLGIEAAFHEANANGGVHGRMLELTSLDDAYEPEAAIANTQSLIEEGVFALIGAVGTPTSRSATPLAAAAGVPYIAPFTGAGFLRDPEWENIINLRASYAQETEEMVERLTVDLGIERIAILYQDDSYGRSGYDGVQQALARRGSEAVAVGRYTRNTSAVKAAVLDIQEGSPEAVIMIGAYQPMAEFIKWGRILGMDALFLNVSFVGSTALAGELGGRRSGRAGHAGGAVPRGCLAGGGGRLPPRPRGLCAGGDARVRLARGLPGGPAGHRGAGAMRPRSGSGVLPRGPARLRSARHRRVRAAVRGG